MKRTKGILIALVIMLLASTVLADEELIQNGGFDGAADTAPDGWYYEAWYTGAENGYAETVDELGQNCAYLYVPEGAENDIRLCQTIKCKANSYYKLTCQVKTENVSGGAGANISVVGSLAASSGVFGTSDGWQTIELTGKTARGQKEITVCVRMGGYGALSSGGAWFDDFTVEYLASFSGDAADFSIAAVGGDEDEQAGSVADGEIPHIGYIILAVLTTALVSIIIFRKYIETDNTPTIEAADRQSERLWLTAILIGALVVRVAFSLIFYGHPTDINCFMAWSFNLANGGLSEFYTSGVFADYPPGYMYVLYLTGSIAKVLGISYASAGYVLLTKLPGIVADLVAAWLVYNLAQKRARTSPDARMGSLPLVLACVVAFNPLFAFISGGWGQIDQILSVLLIAVILLFVDKKVILAGLVYGIAIMVKPQALMVGPILAVAYFCYIKDEGFLRGLWKTVAAVAAACAAIFLLSLPFRNSQEPMWFLSKIIGTATSYPYASIEAFNLMALLGGNWAGIDTVVLGLSYGTWGTIFIALSVAFSAILYIFGRKREKHCLTLSAAWLVAAVFNLGQYMHERYLFPAIMLVLVAFIFYRDKRLFTSFLAMTCAALFNALLAIVIVDNQSARGTVYDIMTAIGSIINLAAFAYLTYASCDIVFHGVKLPAFAEKKLPKTTAQALPDPVDNKLHYTKRDRIFVLAVTVVYGVIALINLGTTTAPETYWTGEEGDTVTVTLERETTLSDIRVFGGLYTGSVKLTLSDGTELDYTEENGDMFRWTSLGGAGSTISSLTIRVTSGEVWFNELAFFDENGKYVASTSQGDGDAALLTDEPDEVPEKMTYMYGMYFDELYHARTAYEHLNGIKPYENSHPPLGKIFIMLGIAVFGMNPLGWRIVGALFGIAMVPIMYAFGKRLFKKSEYALLASVLFAFDFMHYTQTRIATIDVYGVFFIILMFYYMYQYYTMNFFSDGLKKTLKPLALGGLFFGLGAASKWICIYAGGGMAVLLFVSLGKRFIQYRRLRNSDDEKLRSAVAPFVKNTVLTLLWCCVFYIALPVGIYILSYLPYMLCETPYDLKGIWGVQEFMFSYHSGLKATHAYQSPWWQWPLIIRPMWYYVSYDVAEGNIGTISAMGNPAVWWVCCVGSAAALIKLIRGKLKPNMEWFVLFTALLAELLPWVLVTRCTFIYHYFACVPFIILITVYMLEKKEELDPRYSKVKWIWMGAALVLFAAFYPIITGTECSKAYVQIMQWLPSWTFMGY